MNNQTTDHIQAVTVNHNTSRYTELLVRSLYARHSATPKLAVTVLDNYSTDITSLRTLLAEKQIPLRQTGFDTQTKLNSHGEVLQQFVLNHPDCAYYLFLDSDVCFIEDDTIDAMQAQLAESPDLFGIGVRQTWDGSAEIPVEIREAIYYSRLHPCCALVKNTPYLRRIATDIGFTGVTYHGVAGEQYVDTFGLLTKAMQTHGFHHAISPKMVYHFFGVPYDPQWMASKNQRRDALLAALQ